MTESHLASKRAKPQISPRYSNRSVNATQEVKKPSSVFSMQSFARGKKNKSYKRILSEKDLIQLYHSIETALPQHDSRIIQFTSCYANEGTTTIGLELSTLVSGLLGHNVIFVDVEARSSPIGALRQTPIASLIDVAIGKVPLSNAIAEYHAEAMRFDYSFLAADNPEHNILLHIDRIGEVLGILRNQYKLVILHVSGLLTAPTGLSLSHLSDGVVLVLEAERTRAPAAKEALQRLTEKGANVVGMVFNKRRFYIPRWLYRFL